jgi:hypothetical protein
VNQAQSLASKLYILDNSLHEKLKPYLISCTIQIIQGKVV